jgi:hypothetical protein
VTNDDLSGIMIAIEKDKVIKEDKQLSFDSGRRCVFDEYKTT